MSTELHLIEHRLANMELEVKDIHESIKHCEKWMSLKQAEDSNAERSSDKVVKQVTLGATIMLVVTAIISILYKGPLQ